MILPSVWEDQAVWNVDFIDIFPLTTPHDLGDIEAKLLSLLSFDVSLKVWTKVLHYKSIYANLQASEFAKIYFDLRAKDPQSGQNFKELNHLTKEGEDRLEIRSKAFGSDLHRKMYRSSGSLNDLHVPSPRSVIN